MPSTIQRMPGLKTTENLTDVWQTLCSPNGGHSLLPLLQQGCIQMAMPLDRGLTTSGFRLNRKERDHKTVGAHRNPEAKMAFPVESSS